MVFQIADNAKMTLLSTGQLQLSTYGSETYTGTAAYQLAVDSSGNIIETTDGGGNVSGSGTNNYLTRWTGTNSVGNSNIFDNGTVGVGTAANLNGKVTIREAGNSGTPNHIFCMLSSAAVGHGASIFLKTSTSHNNNRYGARIRAIRNDNNNAAADLAFSLENTAASGLDEVVRFTSDGSVGIGITNPSSKLHVYGNNTVSNLPNLVVQFSATGTGGLGIGDENGTDPYLGLLVATDNFHIKTGGNNKRVTVLSGGNVGIGTATPRTNLHVYGTGVDNGLAKIRIGGNTNNTAILELAETQNGSGAMTYGFSMRADGGSGGGSTNDFQLRYHDNSTSGVIGMTMQRTTGQVGIGGVYSGTYRLYVYGDGYMTGNLGLGGTLTEASSLAIKENIETFEPSLDIINKIRPVKYDKKTTGKKEIGLIAEELAELFPELVEKDEKGNPSGVNYSRAVTVLLGGFKELYKEVQELKKRI